MNVLLVYPGLFDGFLSYGRGGDWFNHGVGILSAVLKNSGFSVSYLDCRQQRGWDDVRTILGASPLDAVLISVASTDFDAARTIAKLTREAAPRAKVMVGGPHPTLMTEQTLSVQEFDFVFTHEAELTLPLVLRELATATRLLRGTRPDDLDTLPFVDRELQPAGETPVIHGLQRPYFSITASRGCLYNCSFCQPAEREVFGNRVRKRSVGNLLDELQLLKDRYGMRSFMIHDDCFTQYPSWVIEFCAEKARRGLRQPFVCQSRADIVCRNPGLFKEMHRAGLRGLLVGFESGSDRVLKFVRKGVTVEQNLEAAQIVKRLDIALFANYMLGLPTETSDEMLQTATMMQAIKPDVYSPAVFTPAPGSDLFAYCVEHELLLNQEGSQAYSRSPGTGAKIAGVDYSLVQRMIELSKRLPIIERARRKVRKLRRKVQGRIAAR